MPIGFERTLAIKVESEGVGEFTDSIGAARAKLLKFRKAIGLAGGALAALSTGALVAAANEARQFEQAMVEVEKVTNPETAREMADAVREMSETIPLAQEELARITADAGRFGIRGTENIEAFTRSVAKMATATNLSTDEAGEALARLTTLTGVPVENVENLGSVINELSNNFATSSQEIVDSMLRSSAALSQMGLTAPQISGLSAALNEVSESSERAGTRLRRVAQELMDPKKVGDLAEAWGMTREQFREMRKEEPAQLIMQMARSFKEGGAQARTLRDVLSTPTQQALAGMAQNLDGVRESLDMANREMREGTSLQEEFDAATDTFNARLKTTQNRLRNEAIAIGNELLPALTKVTGAISGYLDSSDTLLASLSNQQKAWGLVALAIAGAGAAGWAFIGGPMTALVAASAAFAAAWISDWADIRSTTVRSLNQIALAQRQSAAAMNDSEQAAREQMDVWGAFTTSVAQGFDSLMVGLVTFADLAITATNQVINAIVGVVNAFGTAAGAVEDFRDDGQVDLEKWSERMSQVKEDTVSDFNEINAAFQERLDVRKTEAFSRSRVRQGRDPIPGTRAADRARTTIDEVDQEQSSPEVAGAEAAKEFEKEWRQSQAATPAATGVRTGGGGGPSFQGRLSRDARESLGLAARGAKRGRLKSTTITPGMLRKLVKKTGSATPGALGVGPRQFDQLAAAAFGEGGRPESRVTTGGPRPTGAGGGAGDLAPLVTDFGQSVDKFAQAVKRFADQLPLEVLVDVDADELERIFEGKARGAAQTVQQQQSRRADRLRQRGAR